MSKRIGWVSAVARRFQAAAFLVGLCVAVASIVWLVRELIAAAG